MHQLAEDVPLTSGAVRRVYTIDGSPVRSLDDIKDGGMYVASGGETFKRVPYLLDDENVGEAAIKSRDIKSRRNKHTSYGMLNSDINTIFNQKERPIFGASVCPSISFIRLDKGIQSHGFQQWGGR